MRDYLKILLLGVFVLVGAPVYESLMGAEWSRVFLFQGEWARPKGYVVFGSIFIIVGLFGLGVTFFKWIRTRGSN